MRIAVAGKGGSGKTTIAGTLSRLIGRAGRDVVAVDADTNPNLATTLGIESDRARQIVALPRTLLTRETQPDGSVKSTFARDPLEVLQEYAAPGPDNVRLVVMGAVGHAGAGWMCGAHATVRGFLGELVSRSPNTHDIVVDMEAGLEHLSRGTGRHVTRFLAVVEPYYRSMETARRIAQLARELGVAQVQAVVNKIRSQADRDAVVAFCATHGLDIIAEIPDDATLAEAERTGRPPIEFTPAGPAVTAIRGLAETLLASG